ncbi:protein containing Shikimate kinase domain protein, partial [gut metagenome]
GLCIDRIFSEKGEKSFREMERDCLEEIIFKYENGKMQPHKDSCRHLVISLGGGTVTTSESLEKIREKTFCIYLKAGIETILSHLKGDSSGRPLLNSEKEKTEDCDNDAIFRKSVGNLMSRRENLYDRASDAVITVDGLSPEEICSAIKGLLE